MSTQVPGIPQTTQSQEQTATSRQAPAYVSSAAQNLVNQGTGLTSPFLQVPDYGLMGFNPDQTQAFDYSRMIADNAMGQKPQSVGSYQAPPGYQAPIYNPVNAFRLPGRSEHCLDCAGEFQAGHRRAA
jgi:hypothetical protein